jgi:hypothetical protein
VKLISLTAFAAAAVFGATTAQAGVINGGFESGNSAFTSGYTYKTASSNTYSSPNSCYAEGSYAVVSDPHNCHDLWASFAPHSGNEMMVVNGAPDSSTLVWSETLSVTNGAGYQFSLFASSVYPTSPAELEMKINGVSVGTLTLTSTPGEWLAFNAGWAATSSTAVLSIYDLNTAYSGNDFALDDISFTQSSHGRTVPEPLTLSLFGAGLLGMAVRRRRGNKARI